MAHPYWTQPLPSQYNWGTAGFLSLTSHAAQLPEAYRQAHPTSTFKVAPVVATYTSLPQKQTLIGGALPGDQPQYAAGVVVGSTARFYPVTKGGIGFVTSPMQNATQASATGASDWHTVGVMRQGGTVWIHDPAYIMDSQTRLPQIPGTSNVTRLLDNKGFGNVTQVQVQGFGSAQQDCMGRSAQWVDNVLGLPDATAPYTPNTFVPGQVLPSWQVVQRH